MDGNYQKTVNLKAKKWLLENIKKVRGKKFIDSHVDCFIEKQVTKGEMLKLSLSLFVCLMDKITKPEKYMLVLIIPLKDIKKFESKIPDLSITEKYMTNEPPSIYVIDRNLKKYAENIEEIRIPFNSNEMIKSRNVIAYYRIFRYEEARLNKWEFSRCIYFEHYPGSLL